MSGWAAGAIVVGAIGGALIQANAAKQAAKGQQAAAQNANQLQWDMYQQQREDQAPWREQGGRALSMLGYLMGTGANQAPEGMGNLGGYGSLAKKFGSGDFTADPGYQFRLDEGRKALERSAAARGMSLSGAQAKALTNFNQNFASNEYQNAYNRFNVDQSNLFNRLSGIAGTGQQSAQWLGNLGAQTAGSMGQNLMGAANAQGAAGIANANAWSSAINSAANNWNQYSMWKNMSSPQQQGMYNYNPWGGNLYGSGYGGTEVIT